MDGQEAILSGNYNEQAGALVKDGAALLPGVGSSFGTAVDLVNRVGSLYVDSFFPAPSDSDFRLAYTDRPQFWSEVFENSKADPATKQITEWWASRHNDLPSPGATEQEILAHAPDVAAAMNSAEVREAMSDVNTWEEAITRRTKKIEELLEKSTSKPQQPTAGTTAGVTDDASIQQEYADTRAGASIFSNLLLLSGDKRAAAVAKEYQKISGPTIDFLETVSRFNAKKVSTWVLANGALGLGVALISAFGEQPDPVLIHLGVIQKQLAEFQEDVRRQFEQVNQKLDGLLEAAVNMVREVQENKRLTADVSTAIMLQQDTLDELLLAINSAAKQLEKVESERLQFICLEEKKSYPGDQIKPDKRKECLALLHFRASKESFSLSDYFGDSARLWTALSGPESLPLVAAEIGKRSKIGLTTKELPNVAEWASAVDSYVQFVWQWLPDPAPAHQVASLQTQGRRILKAEKELLGASRDERTAIVEKALLKPIHDDSDKAQRVLSGLYEKERDGLLNEGTVKDLKVVVLPCQSGVTLYGEPRASVDLRKFPLDGNILNAPRRVDRLYHTRAGGVMSDLEVCYSEAGGIRYQQDKTWRWKYYIKFRISVGNDMIGEATHQKDVGNEDPFFDAASHTRDREWAADLEGKVADILSQSVDKYLNFAKAKCDAPGECKSRSWLAVAKLESGNPGLEQVLNSLGGNRKLAELAFALGAPESLRKRPLLADLLNSYSSRRLPDKKLIEGGLGCLRLETCTAEGSDAALVLLNSRVAELFQDRYAQLEQQMRAFATDDPLGQADPSVAVALVRLAATPTH
jgi:hypothetical protein